MAAKKEAVSNPLLFCFLFAIVLALPSSTNQAEMTEYSQKLAQFSINVYDKLTTLKPNSNVVFSPFSIQTCAAMARLGAEGETAAELDRGLLLPAGGDLQKTASTFKTILEKYQNSNILSIANKIYVMQGFTVQPSYNELLSKNFFSSAEEINFANNVAAAKTMNSWVESKTNNLIKDLVAPDALDSMTRLVLLNAIHFKGTWKTPFPKSQTHDDQFYLNDKDSVTVPLMSVKAKFNYAEVPALDAKILEMPYENSDLSMLIVLPNSRTGLKELERKLQTTSLASLTKNMYKTQVFVKMPKFKAEFSIELNQAFQQLGMSRMFSSEAEFGRMVQLGDKKVDLQVSKVIHKAFIDVNEEGTEAAAATVAMVTMRSAPQKREEDFIASHPFYYAIMQTIKQEQEHKEDGEAAIIRKKRSANLIEEFTANHPFHYVIIQSNKEEQAHEEDGEGGLNSHVPLFMGTLLSLDEISSSDAAHDEL